MRPLSPNDRAACSEAGVEIVSVPPLEVVVASRWLSSSYRLYRALRGSEYDALVFEGHAAYCTARARQLGIDFDGASIVVRFEGVPGRTRGFLPLAGVGELVTQRLVLELADSVVCDDGWLEWWEQQGWAVPHRRYVWSGHEGEASGRRWADVLQPIPATLSVADAPTLVTVVVPVHERTVYLDLCLEALARQTQLPLEVIVADDGSSSQSTVAYLAELERRPWPWTLCVLRLPHAGVASARNAGARVATGDAVLFVDDDDVPFDELIEVLVRGRRSSGADVIVAGARVFRGEGRPRAMPADKITIGFGEPRELGLLGNHFGHPTCLWPRGLFEDGGFREVFFEDWELLARATLQGARVVATPEPLFWYRHVSRGRFTSATATRREEGRFAIAELYADHLPDGMRLLPMLVTGAYGELDHGDRAAQVRPSSFVGRARRLAAHAVRRTRRIGRMS